jgi:hypothetical protein
MSATIHHLVVDAGTPLLGGNHRNDTDIYDRCLVITGELAKSDELEFDYFNATLTCRQKTLLV